MPFLDIRYPTGHLAKIEVEPNAPLVKALEVACAKRELSSRNYALMHKKRNIDLSLSFRFSGLTNHAAVELIEADEQLTGLGSKDERVRLCLRLENGERIQWSGFPRVSLWAILEELAATQPVLGQLLQTTTSDNITEVPVVVYIQQQLPGERCLRRTTLADLGVRCGSLLMQLSRRTFSTEQLSAIESELFATADVKKSRHVEKTVSNAPLADAVTMNILSTPDFSSGQHRGQMATFPQPLASTVAEPFSVFSDGSAQSMFGVQPIVEPSRPKTITLGEILGLTLASEVASPGADAVLPLPPFKFPVETEGCALYTAMPDLCEGDPASSSPCDRELIVFQRRTSPVSGQPSAVDEELPDHFFEPTEAELRRIIVDLRHEGSDNKPLLTQDLRDVARNRAYAKYSRCIIKLVWPDDVIMQACFRPSEPVSALYSFVSNYLVDESLQFELYTTPPKVVLSKKDQTLIQASLVPMSKVYFRKCSDGCSKGVDVLKHTILLSLHDDGLSRSQEVASKWMCSQKPS